MKNKNLIVGVITLLQIGCATNSKSMLMGGAIGAGLGSAIGNQNKNDNGAVVGALIGAGIGTLIGHEAYKDKIKKMGKPDARINQDTEFSPFLTKPDVQMYWVPDSVQGDKFIEKHRVWIIKRPSSWSKD